MDGIECGFFVAFPLKKKKKKVEPWWPIVSAKLYNKYLFTNHCRFKNSDIIKVNRLLP
jgi:hypothetical protein